MLFDVRVIKINPLCVVHRKKKMLITQQDRYIHTIYGFAV